MADLGKTVQDESGASRPADEGQGSANRGSRTAGTNRDYDESQESENQGHGHPREERGRSDESGRSNERITEADRQERDLGGPGG